MTCMWSLSLAFSAAFNSLPSAIPKSDIFLPLMSCWRNLDTVAAALVFSCFRLTTSAGSMRLLAGSHVSSTDSPFFSRWAAQSKAIVRISMTRKVKESE
jgi:hypothetical protein